MLFLPTDLSVGSFITGYLKMLCWIISTGWGLSCSKEIVSGGFGRGKQNAIQCVKYCENQFLTRLSISNTLINLYTHIKTISQ